MSSASPPVFVPAAVNNRLWHIPFCRAETLPEQLVKGREDIFFRYEFEIQGGKPSEDAIAYYVDLLSRPDVLTGSFGFYRALDATLAQNETRKRTPLSMPVLAIGGEQSYGLMSASRCNRWPRTYRARLSRAPGTGSRRTLPKQRWMP